MASVHDETRPFKYFQSSSEIIRRVVMLYIRLLLSLRKVDDSPDERGIDISHEVVRFWWNRFGPMFAAEVRESRIEGMQSSHWRRHMDKVSVKIMADAIIFGGRSITKVRFWQVSSQKQEIRKVH